MQVLKLNDEIAEQLKLLAKQAHLSTNDLIAKLLVQYQKKEDTPTLNNFIGVLKDSPNFKGSPLDIQETIRHEWD